MASQFLHGFADQHPDFNEQLENGEFSSLHQWLDKNIYSFGASKTNEALLINATGESLSADYFINEIHSRYLSE